MHELAIYLLKINIGIALFYFGYFFLLKRLTFYTLNRFYLVFAIICSALFPFIKLPLFFKKAEVIVYALQNTEATPFLLPEFEHQPLFIWTALLYLYWLVVAVSGIKLIIRLVSLYRVRMQSSPQQWRGYSFRNLQIESTPFSFLNTIYLNRELHDDEELQTILKHEHVHTQGLHSLDVLLAEVWTVFSWFNPLSYFIKNAIQTNIEFIADREVVTQGTSNQQYQASLLRSATQAAHMPLVNQFSFLSLKSRIIMMNKKQSSKKQLGKYVFLIPVIITSLFIFGVSKAYQASEPIEILLEGQLQKKDTVLNQDTVREKKESSTSKIVVRGYRTRKLNEDTQFKIRGDGSGFELEKVLVIIDGVEQEKTINEVMDGVSPNEIEAIEVIKDESTTAIYGKKGEKGVVLITTKEKAKNISEKKETPREGEVSSGKEDGSIEVQGFRKEELDPKSEKDTSSVVPGYRSMPKSNNKSTLGFNIRSSSKDNPLIIIDGKEVDEGEMQKVKPELIKSISVFKGKEAIEKYGEKKGENGVILIELKKVTP